MKTRLNVGICSIGSGVGQSVIDSCRLSLLPIHTVGLGNNALAYGLYECDDYAFIPSYYSDKYILELIKVCENKKIKLIIPGHDDEAMLIASNIDKFNSVGIEVIVSSSNLIRICRAKETMPLALPVVADLFVRSYSYQEAQLALVQDSLIFPLISTPRDGYASKGVYIVNSKHDFYLADENCILQEIAFPHKQDPNYESYLESLNNGHNAQVAEISVQLLCDKKGIIKARCATYNKLNNGVPIEILPIENKIVDEAVDRLIPELIKQGLSGPINIQGRITEDGFKIFELNPRFTGITGLRASMGFNEVAACIKHWGFGELLPSISMNYGVFGIRQTANKSVHISRNERVLGIYQSIHAGVLPKKLPMILVTGSTGSIGKRLVEKLSKSQQYIIWTLDRDKRKAESLHADFDVSCFDWDDFNNGCIGLGSVDKVIHLATARPFHDEKSITESLEKSIALFTEFASHGTGEIIFASSQSVYGSNTDLPWKETSSLQPSGYYAQSKYMLELHLESLKRLRPNFSYTIIRIASVTGSDETIKANEALAKMTDKAYKYGVIDVVGGSQVLGIIDIRDVVDALILTVEDTRYCHQRVFNLGMTENYSLLNLANIIAKTIKSIYPEKEVKINVTPSENIKSKELDSSRFNQSFDWKAKFAISDIVRSLLCV